MRSQIDAMASNSKNIETFFSRNKIKKSEFKYESENNTRRVYAENLH